MAIAARRCLPLLISAAVLSATGAHAVDSLEVVHYDVRGGSGRELLASLDANGPQGPDGRPRHGHAAWNIRWSYRLQPEAGGCRLQAPDVVLTTTLTLPRWERPIRAPAALVREWERYSAALRTHEDGHHALAGAAAGDIRKRLDGMRSDAGCDALDTQANTAAQAVLADYRAREIAYDASTDHGASEGARFRP